MNDYLKDVFDEDFVPELLVGAYIYLNADPDTFSKIQSVHRNENQIGFDILNIESKKVETKYFFKEYEYCSTTGEYITFDEFKKEVKNLISEDYKPKNFDDLYESVRLYIILKKVQGYNGVELVYENFDNYQHNEILNYIEGFGYEYESSYNEYIDSKDKTKNKKESKIKIFLK